MVSSTWRRLRDRSARESWRQEKLPEKPWGRGLGPVEAESLHPRGGSIHNDVWKLSGDGQWHSQKEVFFGHTLGWAQAELADRRVNLRIPYVDVMG